MKKIKLITMIVATLFVLSSIGMTPQVVSADQPETNQLDEASIAIVYSTGGLGDQSFNDAAKRGIEAAKSLYGENLTVAEACTSDCEIADINTAIEGYAEDGIYDLIIGIGFSAGDGINSSAQAHPNQNFMIIDFVIDQPNVESIVFKEHEGSFLAGAMAAIHTNTEKLGFLGGLDIPLINRFYVGYEHGARYVNPNIEVIGEYSPDPTNPWNDNAAGTDIANQMMDQDVDIIFAAAGATGLGVISAVEAANEDVSGTPYYAIGVDSNQDHISPGNVLTSMVKRVDVAVENSITKILDGSWSNGVFSLGLAEDGVGITEMEYTLDEKVALYEGSTAYNYVQDLKQAVINGTIDVASTFDELDEKFPEGDDEEAETVPFSTLSAFFSILAVATLVRRKYKN